MKKAIQEGDLDEVMTMVDEDPGMMAAVDPKGRTALYLAVKVKGLASKATGFGKYRPGQ